MKLTVAVLMTAATAMATSPVILPETVGARARFTRLLFDDLQGIDRLLNKDNLNKFPYATILRNKDLGNAPLSMDFTNFEWNEFDLHPKFELHEPNRIGLVIRDANMVGTLEMEHEGEPGTVEARIKGVNFHVEVALGRQNNHHLSVQMTKCFFNISELGHTVTGFGDLTNELSEYMTARTEQGKAMLSSGCVFLQQLIAQGSDKLGELPNHVKVFDEYVIGVFLANFPKVTESHLEIDWNGFIHKDDEDEPSLMFPLSDGDSGLVDDSQRQFYFWITDALINNYLKVFHESDFSTVRVNKDSDPEKYNRARTSISAMAESIGKTLDDDADIEVTLKTAEPPTVLLRQRMDVVTPVELKMVVDVNVKLNAGADNEKELSARVTGDIDFSFGEAEQSDDEAIPMYKNTKLHVSDITVENFEGAELSDDQIDTMRNTFKERLQKFADKVLADEREDMIKFKKVNKALGKFARIEESYAVVINHAIESGFSIKLSPDAIVEFVEEAAKSDVGFAKYFKKTFGEVPVDLPLKGSGDAPGL